MTNDVEEVKRRINLVDFIQSYLPLKKAGVGWKGLCPFHQEKSPSFHVNPERQSFKCFGCGKAGDALDFVMEMERLTFPEALQMLADRVGVILDKRKTPEEYRQEKDEKSRLFQINRLAAEVFHKVLREHPKAEAVRNYLKERGISEVTIATFRLGYAPPVVRGVPGVLERFLASRGFRINELRQAGSPERFSHRLIFPLWDVLGNVIGFTGRALDPNDQPKYLNTPETPLFRKSRVLYPLHQAKEAMKERNRTVLVEGQMDVLLAHQLGTTEAVATSGTALTAEHLAIVGRYTSRILFAFDADPAGIEATRKAILLAYDLELEPQVVTLPTGVKDLGELALSNPETWTVALDQAVPAFTWQLESALITLPQVLTATGKKAVGKLLLPILGRMPDPIERAHWTQVLARRLQIPERTVAEALGRFKELRSTNKELRENESRPMANIRTERLGPEEVLIGLVLLFPEHLPHVASKLDQVLFTDARLADLAKRIGSWYTRTASIEVALFQAAIRTDVAPDEQKWFDQLLLQVEHLHSQTDQLVIRQEIEANLDQLRRRRQEVIKEQAAQAIAAAEASGDRVKVQELLKELQAMLKERS